MDKCDCFLKDLGIDSRAEYADFSNEKLGKRYRNLSLLVHPDEHVQDPDSIEQAALKAQQLLITASKTPLNEKTAKGYVKDGSMDPGSEHDCKTHNGTIGFIRAQVNKFMNRCKDKQIIVLGNFKN